MTEPSHAVFLSYASQDAEAAQRICEALRAAGIEVWFDQSELRGGDAWDRQIRKQIHDCALFIPIISANSQARLEGYFRLEWKLAVERTHLMSDRVAFLLPVVIDDTSDAHADVPERFRAVQWTRVPGGVTQPEFAARIKRLLSPEPASARATANRVPPTVTTVAQSRIPIAASLRSKSALWAIGVVLAVVLSYFLVDRIWLSRRTASPAVSTTARAQSSSRAAPDKSIAVLPFVDMSEKHDQEFFADGMAEEIINLLSRVPHLHVPARTSSFYFKGKAAKISDVARELGVANVLEGSIRRSGDQLRVTVQLVRADNGYHIWSETYDRDLHDVFKVQDDIANSVVQALQISLTGGPLTRQAGGTQNLVAYQLYLRGFSAEKQNTRESIDEADHYFDQATQADPAFGLAWAARAANVLLQADSSYLPPQEGYPRARQLAQHALELSPELAEARAALGYVHCTYEWDWAAAEREMRVAQGLDPDNRDTVQLHFGGILAKTLGHWDDAERKFQLVLDRDPLFPHAIWALGLSYYGAGRYADAEASYRKVISLYPDFNWAHAYLGETLLAEGRVEAALAMVQQEVDGETRYSFLPIVLQAAGRRREAADALQTLIAIFAGSEAFRVAINYAYLHDPDRTFQWLDRAYEQKDPELIKLLSERILDNVANDPRYKAFLRKMNLPE